ncbi:hypothetical protein PCASD_19039 [Puccinia coronata f. sp. avenae]|nr:hypothetical protein PCASD_19039 [Puccinia coronata f. sp. avenae]
MLNARAFQELREIADGKRDIGSGGRAEITERTNRASIVDPQRFESIQVRNSSLVELTIGNKRSGGRATGLHANASSIYCSLPFFANQAGFLCSSARFPLVH